MGQRQATIHAATESIAGLRGTRLVAVADLIETDAEGGPAGQGRYLNGAIGIDTELSPTELMAELLRIERELGRIRAGAVRNGPRVIDLDLLLYGDEVVADEGGAEGRGLTVPHPRMQDRRFVLEPLAQIAPDAWHPLRHATVAEMLKALPAQHAATRAFSGS